MAVKKNISFKPKARLILQLGDRLIANEKIAISEVIKNSYDANARKVTVVMNDINDVEKAEIIIVDDGKGMNLDILENVWMEPGTNYKEKILKECQNINNNLPIARLPIGEKGIGRFGVHKLGNKIELISKQKGFNEVKLFIDWKKFDSDKYLEDEKIEIIEKELDDGLFFDKDKTGTYIRLTDLRKEWQKRDFRTFYRNAMSLVSPFSSKDDFTVEVKSNLNWEHGLINLETVKKNALWYFKISTKNGEIDTFKYKFRPYKYMEKLENKTITELDEYISHDKNIKRKEGKEYINIDNQGFGDIEIEGYIFDFDKNTLDLSDINDRKGIKDYVKDNGGVRVYRDGMRIYDYGEFGNDWLGLDQARINAPTSKIGNKLILSSISLKRQDSSELEEKTNREGFIENEVFNNFRDTVIFILNKVNFLRNVDKDKIRNIYRQEVDLEESTVSIIKKVEKKIKNEKVIPLEEDRKQILANLNKIEENYNDMKDTLLKSAGTGLAYSLIIHEIEKMVAELKSRVAKTDIGELKDLTNKLQLTLEGITNLFINSKLENRYAKDVIAKSMKFFKYRVKTHNIELVKKYEESSLQIECSENFIINALMNLVDNSIYWFKYQEDRLKTENKPRKILIDVVDLDDRVGIVVADTGFGFSIAPETAILPFKTTKLKGEGMGLGLYFVNEIMKMHNGNLRIVSSQVERQKLNLKSEYSGAIVVLEFYKDERK
jgi:signal transduction histidine kinase